MDLNDQPGTKIVGTDQNIDFLNDNSNTRELINLNTSFGFVPTIVKPTRVTHNSSTLIDNLYVSSNCINVALGYVLNEDISDHYPCIVSVNISKPHHGIKQEFFSRRVTTELLVLIREELHMIDWTCLQYVPLDLGFEHLVGKIQKKIFT